VERRPDAGETLVEVMVAVAIMGLAVVAIVGAIFSAVRVSDANRQQARAVTVLRAFAETLGDPDGPDAYVHCATTSTYGSGFTAPAGYTASVSAVRYLANAGASTASWTPACPGIDTGAQLLTVRVTAPDGRSEQMIVVKRDARCDVGSTAC
jgi:Tfp pilus assembly protein PilV